MPAASNLQDDFFFFFKQKKGILHKRTCGLVIRKESARILLIIMLAILDQMRTSLLARMLRSRIPACNIFRVLFVTLCNAL